MPRGKSKAFEDWAPPFSPDTFFHVYNRGNHRRNIFLQEPDHSLFLNRWRKYIHPVAETHSYSLLPNHFHAVVRIRSEKKLHPFGGIKGVTAAFRNFFIAYARSMQERYQLHGNLFHRRFRRKMIGDNDYLMRSLAYVMINARKHGLVKDAFQHRHTSLHAMFSEASTLLERDAVLGLFGGVEGLMDYLEQYQQELIDWDEMEED